MKNNVFPFILKSALAGLLIALAGIAYLNTKAISPILGAFLFSFGLIGVILLEANLYTGKVGYINSKDKFIDAMVMLAINLAVAFIVGLIYRLCMGVTTAMDTRLEKEWYRIFFDGVGCGALIYLAVEVYKKTKSIIVIILCIMAFILAGFEHCIADIFYYATSEFTLKGLLYILIVIVGNSAGSLIIRFLQVGLLEKKPNAEI